MATCRLGCKNGMMLLTCKLFILMSLFCVVQGTCPGLSVYEGDREINTDDVCIAQYRTPDCIKFYQTSNQEDLPADFSRFTYPVESPNDLEVKGIESPFHDWIYPGLSVRWRSPGKGAHYWLGYLVVWFYKNATDTKCQMFRMRIADNERLLFQYNISFVTEASEYTVRVYSLLPLKLRSHRYTLNLITANIRTGTAYKAGLPGDWTPFISYTPFMNGTIEARFPLPPRNFSLTRFSVYLMSSRNQHIPYFQTTYTAPLRTESITEGYITLRANETGSYKIVIWPEDDFWKQPSQCLCWIIENDAKICKNTCSGSETQYFYVNPQK